MGVTRADFDFVASFIHDAAGIVIDEGQEYLVESRLDSVRRARDFATLEEVVIALRTRRDAALAQLVVDAMTTNETSFFRDFAPFEWLRTVHFPALLMNADRAPIRIWCAGCSFGQEPYSIALMAREHFEREMWSRFQILGTDVSSEALNRARAGEYSHLEVNRGLPASMLARYFKPHGRYYRLDESIRSMVEFRALNLLDVREAMTGFDVVMLRNVLIYFDRETRLRVLDRARRALRLDGILLLGSTETAQHVGLGLERNESGRTVFYRRSS